MKTLLISVGLAAALAAAANADDRSDITALEAEWGRAFLAADYAAVERIVAPEFKLLRVEDEGSAGFTPRERWLTNARGMTFNEYETKVIDVSIVGDTAVATVEGRWKVSMAGRGSRDERFVLTDTWIKRDGSWQAMFRHSRPLVTETAS